MDMLAGKRAGCATVGLLRGREPAFFDPAPPGVLVESMEDLWQAARECAGVTRRGLFVAGGIGLLTAALPGEEDRGTRLRTAPSASWQEENVMDLEDIPSLCSHEHWGSVASFGMEPEGFRADVVPGATPIRRTGLLDVLLDPYLAGFMTASGSDLHSAVSGLGVTELQSAHGADLEQVWTRLREPLRVHETTGAFQAIRRGIRRLHGADIAHPQQVRAADERIASAYGEVFAHYKGAMKRANLRNVIRPVHPEFYWRDTETPSAREESALIRTVVRIDPLMNMWQTGSARREKLAQAVEIDPGDARSWRAFLRAIFERAAAKGAVGIKQLAAYTRSLEYGLHPDASVRFRGDLTDAEVHAFQDWVVHECCKLADDLGWPHQIHVGTHNLPQSNPLPLGQLAARYRRMPLVWLHCWPYHVEAGWLAWQHPNVYLDGCWLAVLNPAFLEQALTAWLGLVPMHKILCGHDATSVEMAVGAVEAVRRILGRALAGRVSEGAVTEGAARKLAWDILYRNAARLYGCLAEAG